MSQDLEITFTMPRSPDDDFAAISTSLRNRIETGHVSGKVAS